MSSTVLRKIISLQFAPAESAGKPIRLDEESLKKLDLLPALIKKLIESYGAELGEPELVGGCVTLEFQATAELFPHAESMVADLEKTVAELEINSKRQPPQSHEVAVSSPGCVPLLRSLSRAAKVGLTVFVEVDGKRHALPKPDPSIFTEPEEEPSGSKMLYASVVGLCKPREHVFVLVLASSMELHLPKAAYQESMVSLQDKIFMGDASFEGTAVPSGRVMVAEPGGHLISQSRFQAASETGAAEPTAE